MGGIIACMQEEGRKAPIEISVGVLSQLVRYLHFLKVDVDKLFRSRGMDPAILGFPDRRIPFDAYIAVEDEAVRVTGDPYFGLHWESASNRRITRSSGT